MARYTLHAQRATTKVWLDRELPLTTDGPEFALSAAGMLTGTLPQGWDTARSVADRQPMMLEYGTLIHVDADGIHRGAFLVTRTAVDEQGRLAITAAGFSTYPHGLPFESELVRVNADPAQLIRDIWGHVQGHPDGDLGVRVLGSTTVRLGTDSDAREAVATANLDAAKAAKETTVAQLKAAREAATALRAEYSVIVAEVAAAVKAAGTTEAKEAARNAGKARKAAKQAQIDAQVAVVKTRQNADTTAKELVDARREELKTAKAAAKDDGGAYRLNWWDTPDCGTEISALTDEAPLDWVEETAWDGDDAVLRIRIGYPRLGRRRTDLAFVEGENITELVLPERDGQAFANAVIGLGAGEGKGSLRHAAAIRDGRLRRVHVLPAKDIGKKARLEILTRAELARRQAGAFQLDEITVREHPSAPLGAWALGDDIRVQALVPHYGELDEWFRVISWRMAGENTAILRLERSDAYNYGS